MMRSGLSAEISSPRGSSGEVEGRSASFNTSISVCATV